MDHGLKALVAVVSCALSSAAFAAGQGEIYHRDSGDVVELTNLPEEEGYKLLVEPSDQSAANAPQSQRARPPIPGVVPLPAADAPLAEPSTATPQDREAADAREAKEDQDDERGSSTSPAAAEQTARPGTQAQGGRGGYVEPDGGATPTNTSGSNTAGSSTGAPQPSGQAVSPGANTGTTGTQSAATNADPDLTVRLQQYRELMLHDPALASGRPPNPAASRRYMMVDRPTYQSNIDKASGAP